MRRLMKEIGEKMSLQLQEKGLLHSVVFEDNNGALGLATSARMTPKTKHIVVKYHFLKSHISVKQENGCNIRIAIVKIESKVQKADIFTEGLPMADYEKI